MAEQFDEQAESERPDRQRLHSGANGLPSVALTTKFLARASSTARNGSR